LWEFASRTPDVNLFLKSHKTGVFLLSVAFVSFYFTANGEAHQMNQDLARLVAKILHTSSHASMAPITLV